MLLLALSNAESYYWRMSRVTRLIRLGIVTIACVLIGTFPAIASAAAAPSTLLVNSDVFITEFQTNGGVSSQEFIEIYNATDKEIIFDDSKSAHPSGDVWKVQFFNSASVKPGAPVWSTAPTSSNSITLSGSVKPKQYYLLSSTGYNPGGTSADQYYDATSSHLMTDTGGALQLLQISAGRTPMVQTTHDQVMWLAATTGISLAPDILPSPAAKLSLQRRPDENESYVRFTSAPDGTASATLAGFMTESAEITPLEAWQPPLSVVPDPPTENSSDGSEDVTGEVATPNDGLASPTITELLPNPASPLTDSDDEFIELYNPNNASFDLKGYSLEVGTTTHHSYVFTDDTVLPAASYQAFYSSDTKLSLTNGGSQARLRDPAGMILSETSVYGTAADNQSWIQTDGAWQWSTTATPGAENIISLPAVKAVAKATTKTAAVKKTAIKTTAAKTTTKKAAKKATMKKPAAKKVKTTKKATISTAASIVPKPPIHTAILVAVATCAVLYGLYEYRHDISDKLRRLRRHRTAGPASREEIVWRGGYNAQQ
jgi:hypothetical protein